MYHIILHTVYVEYCSNNNGVRIWDGTVRDWGRFLLTCSHFFNSRIPSPFFFFFFLYSNNEDEVREEWERIQIAYTILIDNKMRKRYDRSEMIADPGAAVRRAAVDATWTGVSTIGKGLLSLGKKAVESITTTTTTTPTTTTATTTTSSTSNSADDATIDNTDNHNSNKQATM